MTTSINHLCPRSGKPVQNDSLTTYRGQCVGFCNPGCRDDFDAGGPGAAEDRRYFDVLMREQIGLLESGQPTGALLAQLPILTSGRIRLRAPRVDDADALFALFSDVEVTRYWSHPPFEERDQATAMIINMHRGAMGGQIRQWAIADIDNDRLIGTTTLFGIQRAHARAEVGYALRRASWGKGLASEALSLAMDHGERELGLLRFEADVDPANQASLRMLERLGFEEEGRARSRWRVNGGEQDSVLLARLV